MFIQSKVFPHLHALHNRHPRSKIIATLWCRLPCLEYNKNGLESTQSGSIHKRIRMFYQVFSVGQLQLVGIHTRGKSQPLVSLGWFISKSAAYCKDSFKNEGRNCFSVGMILLIESRFIQNRYVGMDIGEVHVEIAHNRFLIRHQFWWYPNLKIWPR